MEEEEKRKVREVVASRNKAKKRLKETLMFY